MCLFPRKNKNFESITYKYGIKEFACGVCPECLSKKSRYWALRAAFEAKNNVGCMITLTYDTFVYDENGNIIGENPVNPNIPLCKADVQNFVKRLRYFYPKNNIKYIAAAERGKRTNRAHFHLLLFGIGFRDRIFYKKSKRGNVIYRSKTLEKIWQGGENPSGHKSGICTIDCTNINVATARYCTKYAAKDAGIDDSFMLFSHGIGESELRKKFNGKPYIIDGKEYPIPKSVWKWYICQKYGILPPKYYALPKFEVNFDIEKYIKEATARDLRVTPWFIDYIASKAEYAFNVDMYNFWKKQRDIYRIVRDNDTVYCDYINGIKKQIELNEKYKKSSFERISALDNSKYWSYKQKALLALGANLNNMGYNPPRCESLAYINEHRKEIGLPKLEKKVICRESSRHITTNDRKLKKVYQIKRPSGAVDTIFLLPTAEQDPFHKKYITVCR